jgi:hypothetical protein
VASLVDNDEVELLDYSKRLISIVNERSNEFESSLGGLRAIAEKTGNKPLIEKLTKAERRFEELRKSAAEAHKIADRERAVSETNFGCHRRREASQPRRHEDPALRDPRGPD